MKRIDEYKPVAGDEVYLVVDRMAVADTKDAISRLSPTLPKQPCTKATEPVCYAFTCRTEQQQLFSFSTKFEADGITFEEPNDQMFSFNSSIGACPHL